MKYIVDYAWRSAPCFAQQFIDTIAANIEKKDLYDHQTGSKIVYLEDLATLINQQNELEVQKSKLREAEAALAAITQTHAQTEAEYRRTLYGELVEAERKAAGLARDVDKANEKTRLQKAQRRP
jgi:hemolysin D